MDLSALALAFSKSFLLALAAVLPILNPPASAPVFVNLTRGLDRGVRASPAQRIGLNAALMLAGAMLVFSFLVLLALYASRRGKPAWS